MPLSKYVFSNVLNPPGPRIDDDLGQKLGIDVDVHVHRITDGPKWHHERCSHWHPCNFQPLESPRTTQHHSPLTPPAAPSSPTAGPSMRVPMSSYSTTRKCGPSFVAASLHISNTSIGFGKASLLLCHDLLSYTRRQHAMCGQAVVGKVPVV